MNLLFLHIKDTNNVGDYVCTPQMYFEEFSGGLVTDIDHNPTIDSRYGLVVYGGGVMVGRGKRHLQKNKSSFNRAVLWGGGHTVRAKTEHKIQDLSVFDLVGIRDYGLEGGHHWVPCVSCMSNHFDDLLNAKVTEEVVIYDHAIMKPLHLEGVKRMSNIQPDPESAFRDALEFMASAECVITSSYHGAYWATLLGKKVICVPFGSKFHYLKHKPHFTSEEELSKMNFSRAVQYKDALEECREANEKFHKLVLNL